MIEQLSWVLVGMAGVLSLILGAPMRRAGLVFAVQNIALWLGGFWIGDWPVLIVVNLIAMFATMWHPAGKLQLFIGSGYLATALLCGVYGMSYQGQNAQWVAYHIGTSITIWQALLLLGACGGSLSYKVGFSIPAMRSGMVHFARWADKE